MRCYSQFWASGDFVKIRSQKRKSTSYHATHNNLYNKWGKAKAQFCIFGPAHQASDWAFIEEGTTEVLYHEERGFVMPYSTNPHDYAPMCNHHHNRVDRRGFTQVLLEECFVL